MNKNLAQTKRLAGTIRFGAFDVDVRAAQLRKHGVKLRLPQQSFQILVMLLNRPGEVVLREEIRGRLWPNGTIVEFDHSINAAIKNLRAVLADSPESPRYVETVGRQGYRFIAQLDGPSPAPGDLRDAQPAPEQPATRSGETVAHYRIQRKLGSGAMGEVYLAEDLKLRRPVAMKFLALPSDTVSPQMLERFRREARAAAALSHPNICTVHGTEEWRGRPVIVMEFVQGETLEARLDRGALLSGQALEIAVQIADALAEAKRKGIVHRDLKPANVMLTKFGVKVLDFGLAKTARCVIGGNNADTMEGVILGTPPYMSPEQAQGKDSDYRSDIFSLGVVLYEMLTGNRPFEGDNPASVMAAIIEREPPSLADVAGPVINRVVQCCLAKNPEERWQSTEDLKTALGLIAEAAPVAVAVAPRLATRRTGWIAAGLLMVMFAAAAVMWIRKEPPAILAVQSTIVPPENTSWATLSPDGRLIAFNVNASDGKGQLWVRPLDSLAARAVPGTEGSQTGSFWSPDSQFLAFFADSKLKRIDARGGHPITVCSVASQRGGSWSQEGEMVFAPWYEGPLYRVAASGGVATPATRLDKTRQEVSHRFPWFLPDGRHFLFVASESIMPAGHITVRLGSVDSPESRILVEADSNAVYAQGHLLFLRRGTLLAQAFDLRQLSIAEKPFVVAEEVQSTINAAAGKFGASDNGLLLYRHGTGPDELQFAWFDRNGQRLSSVGDLDVLGRMNLSPDGKKVAVAVTNANTLATNTDIWLYDVARGSRTRFTFDPADEKEAVWSPDGRTIVFSSNRKGRFDLYRKASDGSGAEELLYSDNLDKHPTSWSPDGRFLLYTAVGDLGTRGVWALRLSPQTGGPVEPYPFLRSSDWQVDGQFSPDGRWVAYTSRESGGNQIYVAAFQPADTPLVGKRQVSTADAGVSLPRWRRDGKEIFFLSRYGKLMAAEVSVQGATLEVGETHLLSAPLINGLGYSYDVSTDGQRFLATVSRAQNATEPFTLVQNWQATLKK